MRLFALLVFVVSCGGGGKPKTAAPEAAPDPIPTTAGPDCGVVADKLAIVVHADKPDAQAGARAELKARCAQDKWSDEARSCFATVQTDDEIDGCKQHLSDAQRGAMAKYGSPAAAPAAAAPAPAAGAAPASAPPAPAPAPKKRSTRAPVRANPSSDPQEGGEASPKADPQEGGE